MSTTKNAALPAVLGDSLARGLSKQSNRAHAEQITTRMRRKKFAPPSLRFGAVKRARVRWIQESGAIYLGRFESKRELRTTWLMPQDDGSWFGLQDVLTPHSQDSFTCDAISAHAAQRLLQAKVSIETAARVWARAVCSTPPDEWEYATVEGLWAFAGWCLKTFIPVRALDPKVQRRWQALMDNK